MSEWNTPIPLPVRVQAAALRNVQSEQRVADKARTLSTLPPPVEEVFGPDDLPLIADDDKKNIMSALDEYYARQVAEKERLVSQPAAPLAPLPTIPSQRSESVAVAPGKFDRQVVLDTIEEHRGGVALTDQQIEGIIAVARQEHDKAYPPQEPGVWDRVKKSFVQTATRLTSRKGADRPQQTQGNDPAHDPAWYDDLPNPNHPPTPSPSNSPSSPDKRKPISGQEVRNELTETGAQQWIRQFQSEIARLPKDEQAIYAREQLSRFEEDLREISSRDSATQTAYHIARAQAKKILSEQGWDVHGPEWQGAQASTIQQNYVIDKPGGVVPNARVVAVTNVGIYPQDPTQKGLSAIVEFENPDGSRVHATIREKNAPTPLPAPSSAGTPPAPQHESEGFLERLSNATHFPERVASAVQTARGAVRKITRKASSNSHEPEKPAVRNLDDLPVLASVTAEWPLSQRSPKFLDTEEDGGQEDNFPISLPFPIDPRKGHFTPLSTSSPDRPIADVEEELSAR